MLFHKSFQPYQGHYLRTWNQARALVKAGYDVTVFAWDREARYERHETREGIRIVRYRLKAGDFQGPRNGFKVLRYNWAAFRYLLRADAEIFTCYSLDAILAALAARILRRKKAVLDVCEPDYYAFWNKKHEWLLNIIRWLEKTLARQYDHVFVHNLYQVRKFEEAGVRRVTQVGSYPNRSIMPASPRTGNNRAIVIGRFGTIYEDNGIEEFIAAFSKLIDRAAKDFGAPDYRFLLAGRVLESYRPVLNALIEPLGDRVALSGPFEPPDLPDLYARIDISSILYRRRSEWFRHITPTKLFESLACGVPVLASDMGEVRQIVEEGPCGVIVDEEDPDSICKGIEKLAAEPATRREMSENALRLAREKYTWEVCEPVLLETYRSLARIIREPSS